MNLIVVNYMTARSNLKCYCDKESDDNETVIITRKGEKNVVIVSLDEWNLLQKARKNAEYLLKLEHSFAQADKDEFISKSIKDLEALTGE